MSNELKIMGVQLNMDEAEQVVDTLSSYLKNSQLHTVCAVSMRMIIMAQKDEGIKEILNSYDLALPGEVEILEHANVKSIKLMREIKENFLFKKLMLLTVDEKRSVYLLAENQYQMQELQDYMNREHANVNVVGAGCLNSGKEVAALINEINILSPDVILSVIPSPGQERFIAERKNMLDARIWYGLNGEYRLTSPTRMVGARIHAFLHLISFKNFMARYHKDCSDK